MAAARRALVGAAVALSAFGAFGGCDFPFPMKRLDKAPSLEELAVDTSGYSVDELDIDARVFFVRGDEVYYSNAVGELFKFSDERLQKVGFGNAKEISEKVVDLPFEFCPRLLFVSTRGNVLVSPDWHLQPRGTFVFDGNSWEKSLDEPVWRADEDASGAIYVGTYQKDSEHHAQIYRSTDGGKHWELFFEDKLNHQIHSVRYDPYSGCIYTSFGDTASRGQAFFCPSTGWEILERGTKEGHTDVAFTPDYVFWASDNGSGRVFRYVRGESFEEIVLGGGKQFVWFAASYPPSEVYVGTKTSQKEGGERAAVLASRDNGATWQKLIELPTSTRDYEGFSCSRNTTFSGALYVSSTDGRAWRIQSKR
ncbi:hypothetical protein D6817_01260 [Candidatus Pacearchaeota archaeon]|nr:MAG: hypothetical protein D6817_01260 [Candidatus Pacearchaeota archaeon]